MRNRICVAALLLVVGTASAELEETHAFDPGQTLEFDFDSGGSVRVQGWDRNEAQIQMADRHGEMEDWEISIEPGSNGLVIRGDLDRRRNRSNLKVEVMAPRNVNVEFQSAGGGLELIDVEGEFNGTTKGGRLSLDGVSGDADLRTMGGTIQVRDSELNGRVRTGGGRVLLENVIGDVEATSGGGNVQYKNVRASDGSLRGPRRLKLAEANEETVLISTMGGKIGIDEAPAGANVYTAGGRIQIDNASRFVTAETGGGDVEIEIDQGWVEATTGAGDIDVVVHQDADGRGDITLLSGNGNITLTVPSDFAMDLHVDLGFTRSTKRQFHVESDFGIDLEETEDWDYAAEKEQRDSRRWDSSLSTPKKHIIGRLVTGDGRNAIRIRTVNGNVAIRSN